MIYSAWFELHNDDIIVAHPTALRVYAHLLRNPLIFMHPQDVKAWLIADLLHTHRDRVGAALNLLIERGYVLEHPRGQNNVRRVSLLMDRIDRVLPAAPSVPSLPACPPNKAAKKTA